MTQPTLIEPDLDTRPEIVPFFDEGSSTFSYVIRDPGSCSCAVVDSVLNLDYASGTVATTGADQIIAHLVREGWELEWILETHVHADHLSAAPYLQEQLGGRIAIGAHIVTVQEVFARVFEEDEDFSRDGSQFDVLLEDGETFNIGAMTATAMHTPGHTPACMTYLVGDAAFVGDTLFMPDGGTARADFPGGDAGVLYRSIRRLLSLPPSLRLFMCHDYRPNGRDIAYESTVAAENADNIHVHAGVSESEFVTMREKRDATLGMPALILPSLQVNMRAGHLPPASPTGRVFLKLPLNAFSS